MPRYHFHSADGQRFNDEEGSELPDDAAARVEAIRFSGEFLKSQPQMLWHSGHWRVEVTDEKGGLLFTVITVVVDAARANT